MDSLIPKFDQNKKGVRVCVRVCACAPHVYARMCVLNNLQCSDRVHLATKQIPRIVTLEFPIFATGVSRKKKKVPPEIWGGYRGGRWGVGKKGGKKGGNWELSIYPPFYRT